MPADGCDKRRISLGNFQEFRSPPSARNVVTKGRVLPSDRLASPMQREWHFGGIKLRLGPGTAFAGQANSSPDAICVVLALTDGCGSSPMRLSIYPGERLSTSSPTLRHEVLALEMSAPADGSRSAAPLRDVFEIDAARGPGALLAHHLLQLSEQIAQVQQDRLETLALATRALVEICLAPAVAKPLAQDCPPLCAQPAAERGCASSALIERARLGVRRNLASVEFGPAELARLLAMSRSKLYRLLLPEGGVAHFINRERLLQAQRELAADETASIHAIAARVGFKDHSTFSRAFRRAFGATPTQARANGPIRLPAGAAGGPSARHVDGWMPDSRDAGAAIAGEWDDQPRFGILG
jgi:AraC-like DNA-binding protein